MDDKCKTTEAGLKILARGTLMMASELKTEYVDATGTEILLALLMAQQVCVAEGSQDRLENIERLLTNIECRQAGGIP